ncbi:GSCFA domain-containing protein [Pseudoduganella sp. FT55W]|uniref:GSCFA domain-containing protein n=1 Tax=Duganella rivi TaxID=2666083 RepID=A0A7X4KBD1_9BURK|nr:GSCFA domain-containing protein [Duganella rivi]MYM67030.1 GSCFA domain-containing protein [Duganella rivi]
MALHPSSPYLKVPTGARWKDAVADRPAAEIDPHLSPRLRITPTQQVASAGSCFAQRIAEALQDSGYGYMVAESGPAFIDAADRKALGYGVYSARYGNIYTTLQLLQLFDRAYGRFEPSEPLWRNAEGGYVDPFRPSVQPGGFATESECLWDRREHLAAVRAMFEQLDVFVFTLGLTEAWLSADDGAVFPVSPGSGLGGEFDPARHRYHNFSVAEVTEHLSQFITRLAEVNPRAQVILTVSPVPLMATFEDRHVLQATTYSKAVLRVAVEEVLRRHDNAHYFASYEIVTATGDSNYFAPDRRSVLPAAVAHVIACFRRQYMGDEAIASAPTAPTTTALPNQPLCDEQLVMDALARHAAQGQ